MKLRRWTIVMLVGILLFGFSVALAEDDDDYDYDYDDDYDSYCDHDYIYDYHRDATCTQSAKDYYVCINCGDTYSEKVGSALGHKWSGWTVTAEATCSQAGSRVRKCSRCGSKDTQKVAKLPHSFGAWNIIEQATDHSSGIRHHVCGVCGTEETLNYDPDGTLRKKDKGDEVKELQSMLFCRGLLKENRINGSFDSTTEKAVKKVQEEEGFAVDGVAWPQTLSRLGHQYGEWNVLSVKSDFSVGVKERTCALCGYTSTVESVPSPLLKRKDKGEDVKALQQALNDAGYSCGRVDGDFGGNTERAVMAFERDNNLPEDGIAWPGVIKLIPNLELAGDVENVLSLSVMISPVKDAYREGEQVTLEWTLVNRGSLDCKYWRIDCAPGDASLSGELLTAGTMPLKTDDAKGRSGRCEITVRPDAEGAGTGTIVCRASGMNADDAEIGSEDVSIQINVTDE